MIEIGIKGEQSKLVDTESTAKAMGSGSLEVFATPAMIALMELTAFKSVESFLEQGQGTVGTLIDAKHLSPTPVGAMVICKSELVEVDRKRLKFCLEVSDNCGIIGTAVHERFIIDNEKFMEKCFQKLG